MNFEEVSEAEKNVMTTIPIEEKWVLYDHATKVPDDGIIVDIGTAAGNSAFIMALASRLSVKVWTIDPIENNHFLDKRKELKLLDKVIFLHNTSNEAIGAWDKPIDLLFIDGLHTQAGVINDINNWGKYVKQGSFVLLHDYFWYGNMVQNAIDAAEIKLELIDVPFGYYREGKVGIAITKRL